MVMEAWKSAIFYCFRFFFAIFLFFCYFSVNTLFWAYLAQKMNIASLSWNLVLRAIQIWRIQWRCSPYLFLTRNTLYREIWFKNSKLFVQSVIWHLQPFTEYCEVAHYGKSLISVFQEFAASINKMLILTGRLGTRLLFYKV